MKSNWKQVKLGEVCDVKGGKRLPKGDALTPARTPYPYIKIKDIKMTKHLELDGSFEYITEETHLKISRYIVNVNDIIISIVGSIGFIAKIGNTLNGANLTENCVKLINRRNIDDNYLYYFLSSNIGQEEIKKGTVGAVQAKLPIKNIQEIKLSLPPLETQKQIAKILSSIDDKIELNNRINDNLEQQAQVIFKSWFVDFEPFGGVMPSDWVVGTFSKITNKTLGGDWGKDVPAANYTKHTFCIRGADIPDIKVGKKGKMPTRYILEKNFVNKRLAEGDIVVEISGGSPTQSTGRVAVVSKGLLSYFNEEVICTNFCRALTPKFGYSMFMYHYWQYLYDLKVFFSYENGTTGIKNLDINGFLETEIINIPTLSKVQEFDVLCQTIYHKIYSNGNETEKLAQLRDTLLPKLISGEIDLSQVEI